MPRSMWSRPGQFDLVAPGWSLRVIFLVCYIGVTRQVMLLAYSWENLFGGRFVIASEVMTIDLGRREPIYDVSQL